MRVKTFLGCLLILAIRCWDRILHPGIWAEEGSVWWSDALKHGWSATFMPYEGYFHLFGRIMIQFFNSFFPIYWLPWLITCSAIILYAWVMSLIADQSYRHLVKSDLNRAFIALGLCTIPGGAEILGNLTNTHRILAVMMLFFGLRSIQERYKTHHLVSAFIIAGSAGEVLMLLPLFIYRAYLRYKTDPKIQAITQDLLLMLIILGWTVANVAARSTNTAAINPEFEKILRTTLAAFTFGYVLEPTVGWRMTENLFSHVRIAFWLFTAAFSFVLVRDLWKSRFSSRILIYLGIICLFAIQGLAWIVRSTDMYTFKDFLPGMWWCNTRILFTLTFGGYLVWSFYFANLSKKAGIAYVLLYFALTNPLVVKAYGDTSFWAATAEKVEKSRSTGCPREVIIPLFPEGWKFTYQSQTQPTATCVEQ